MKGRINMAQRKTLPSGWIVYQLHRQEMNCLQKYEIAVEGCDSCHCILKNDVYYIPVLDAWVCEDCMQEWSIFSKRYLSSDEDTNMEIDKMALFEELCVKLNISIQKDVLSQQRIC